MMVDNSEDGDIDWSVIYETQCCVNVETYRDIRAWMKHKIPSRIKKLQLR